MNKIVILIILIALIVLITSFFTIYVNVNQKTIEAPVEIVYEPIENKEGFEKRIVKDDEQNEENNDEEESEISTNDLSDFDLSFLKLEDKKENLVYSPLSIKYALKMLEEAASGDSKTQIAKLIGDYTPTKYDSNENMSLANGLFVKDSF